MRENNICVQTDQLKAKKKNDPPVMTFREKNTVKNLTQHVPFSHVIFSFKLVTKKPALP